MQVTLEPLEVMSLEVLKQIVAPQLLSAPHKVLVSKILHL